MSEKPASDQLYALIANEEDARVCKDIPDEACQEVPRNFFLMFGSLVLTKLGDLLISPKTVLAWLMGAVGAHALVAWLVPIRESGSMIPQLAIGAWMRRKALRKGFWVGGSLGQAVAVLLMAASVWTLDGYRAGFGILAALVIFSLARGFCSVAMKDVQGKVIPKTRRGRLTGLATTVSGILTAVLAALLFQAGEPSLLFYSLLLVMAALLWVIAGALFATIEELPGETDGGGNALQEALRSLSLLRDDPPFRHFVITRALLLCSALAAPYFVVMAQQQSGGAALLATFLFASSLASSVSASIWGWMADRSSRQVLILGATIASATCLLVALLSLLLPASGLGKGFLPLAFFVLSIAHAGVRLGRKTYLVDMAGGNKRTDYTAVSNTVIGVLLLLAGALSALVSLLSPAAVILMLGAMGLCGTLCALRLQEVQ